MKKQQQACDLKNCFMCRCAEPEFLARIAKERETLTFPKGAVIFREGEKATGIYFLLEGSVKVHKQWGTDRELILHFNKKEDMFGYRGMGVDPSYPVTATALEKCRVCFVSLHFFNHLLKTNSALTLRFLNFHLEELRYAENRMRNLALMEVKGRIADTILMLDKHFGRTVDGFIAVNLKRQDLAAYAGTTYETFFRTTNELVKEGSIALEGKKIRVINQQLLERHCSLSV